MGNTPRQSRLLLQSSTQLIGGSGGNGPFTMESSDPNAHITSICLHSASERIIGSLKVHFSNGETSPRYGGQNVAQQCFSPQSGCISKVYFKACLGYEKAGPTDIDSFINTLQFESSDGTSSQLWGYEGNLCTRWLSQSPNNGCLKSITVKSGTLIDAIQFHWF